ncbi:MAG: hypothetical protein WA982_08545, partial [Rubrobacteraceae bacterium]
MLTGKTTDDFVGRLGRALEQAGHKGVHVTAGNGAHDLEAQQFSRQGPEEEDFPVGRPHHLETPPGPRHPGVHSGTSKLCYFLDGVQSSREIGRLRMSPIVVATVAAAIINRCDRRFSRMPLRDTPTVAQAVILPRIAGDESIEALWQLLLDAGFSELGGEEAPSSPYLVLDSAEYVNQELDPSDYIGMKERARGRVRSLRERLEGAMLRNWELDDRTLENPNAWIAVDGQLKEIRESNRRAVGLIKSVARPEFVGKDVGMLLDLEPGMRTTSFVPDWQLRRAPGEHRTSWYLRVWPRQPGADALGSLMRVEAPRDTPPETVDEITRWVLAERAPLAKPDPRWPAMIYPIHYVEKLLKPLVQGSEREYARLERYISA